MKALAFCIALIVAEHSFAAPDPIRLKYEPTEPKFLVPVSPQGRDYQQAVLKILDKRWGLGTMIYDTVGDFFAVSVWGTGRSNSGHDQPVHSFITYLRLDGAGGSAKPESEIDIPIDVEFALTVQRAWATMLLKSRYPEKSFLGADGFTAEFSVWVSGAGAVFGYTWSPERGLSREMVDLGFSLAEYCKAPPAQRSARRAKLMEQLQSFEERAAKAQ